MSEKKMIATREGFGKEIVALDRSDKMFEKGREKCAGMPVNFVIGDACHMDFEDDTFDVVGIGNSLHHIPDLAALRALPPAARSPLSSPMPCSVPSVCAK